MSIVKKNLRAGKGKKRWRRNIDITGLENDLDNQQREQELTSRVQEKLKNEKLFYIDKGPNTLGQKVREALAKDRFKKAPADRIYSKNEEKFIRRKSINYRNIPEEEKNKVVEEEPETFDAWADETTVTKTRIAKIEREVKIAPVIKPHAGQSYNPSFKDHKSLLKEVVDDEIEKNKVISGTSKKGFRVLFNKQRRRPKSLMDRMMQEESKARKQQKKLEHDFTQMKHIIKDMKKVDQELEKAREEKKIREEKEKADLEGGINKKAGRMGKKKYVMRPTEFQTADELAPNLRAVKINPSIVRDQFDSFFRRKLLEPSDPYSRKKKPRRLPLYKLHNAKSNGREEEEGDFGFIN